MTLRVFLAHGRHCVLLARVAAGEDAAQAPEKQLGIRCTSAYTDSVA
jgi:hypothetical protein